MARMHNPPHPGDVLRDGVFADAEVTVTEFAERLGVTRAALSRVINGRAAISAEMALRLCAALGGSAESWLHMQADHDLWIAEKGMRKEVARIRATPAARVVDGDTAPGAFTDRQDVATPRSKKQTARAAMKKSAA